jgi:hypothetical protein
MRTRLATSALLISLLALTAAVSAQAGWTSDNGLDGSGKAETRTLDLQDFEAIDIGGAFELKVTRGSTQKITVTIDDNLWEVFEAKVSGKELTLGFKKDVNPEVDAVVEIVMPTLTRVEIHGAAEVEINDYKGDKFTFNVSGAGELEMDGEVDELDISISGAGEIDTRDLKARSVEISVSGAGEAQVFASESFEGRVSGVGEITYYGNPEHVKTKVSGLGEIEAN